MALSGAGTSLQVFGFGERAQTSSFLTTCKRTALLATLKRKRDWVSIERMLQHTFPFNSETRQSRRCMISCKKGIAEDNGSYEVQLPSGLSQHLMPEHVAIIMDGNSRWAEKKGLPHSAGHIAGTDALTRTVKLSCKWGIRALTVFAFSSENWFRPKAEVDFLMDLFQNSLRRELQTFKRENIRFTAIGDLRKLPNSLQRLIEEAQDATKDNFRLNFIVAVSYSGRNDILQACQRLAEKVGIGELKSEDITENMFEKELSTYSGGIYGSPDLLIRTSGEQRLSNFLLWQLAYAELFFTDCFWPDFGESQYREALSSFQQRNRRFGRRMSRTNKILV
eukprot:TRINITY_DN23562_c0_g1_i1.p1 TRINITY_DN23562_c0_g1~~TRINITY_DN23562_c0_g1_i1.p1  ORF type:complete len:336 (-),score=47.25 TRINITY_DN23562_c0_g1_i1:27-1034(-)